LVLDSGLEALDPRDVGHILLGLGQELIRTVTKLGEGILVGFDTISLDSVLALDGL